MDRKPHLAKPDRRIEEARRVKSLMIAAGISFAMIDKENGFSEGYARHTLRTPNPKGERAIAAALFMFPHHLWPSRYLPSGKRREPQNYERVPLLQQRRNASGVLT